MEALNFFCILEKLTFMNPFKTPCSISEFDKNDCSASGDNSNIEHYIIHLNTEKTYELIKFLKK